MHVRGHREHEEKTSRHELKKSHKNNARPGYCFWRYIVMGGSSAELLIASTATVVHRVYFCGRVFLSI